MSKENNLRNVFHSLLPAEVEGFDSLAELALDMRWSWNHAADELWRQLDPALWELTHNPWVVLQTVSREQLEQVLAEPGFRKKVDGLVGDKREAMRGPGLVPGSSFHSPRLTCVAYFSMEFMLSEALPIYSGGLGNVAGDQLKAASDLGVPVVGVGLLYQQGYFRQVIDQNGAQQALYPYNDPGQLPITPLRDPNGEWLRLEIALPGYSVWLRAWQVQVGRAKLYLLDSNDAANLPAHRGITSELYGGGPELRLKQELVLGIGGWRLLRALGLQPEVCHLNEGHAAFAVLERARALHGRNGSALRGRAGRHPGRQSLHDPHRGRRRLRPVRTRTDRAVPGRLRPDGSASRRSELLALGRLNPRRRHPSPSTWPTWPSAAAARSTASAGLHGQVSRRIFSAAVPALAGGRSARRPRHQRRPYAELGLGGRRRPLDRGLRQGPLAGRPWRGSKATFAGLRRPSSGSCAPPAASALIEYARERLAPAAGRPRAPPRTTWSAPSICSIPTP